MHGDNLRDYEEMHRARTNEIQKQKAKAHEFMRSKPYGSGERRNSEGNTTA